MFTLRIVHIIKASLLESQASIALGHILALVFTLGQARQKPVTFLMHNNRLINETIFNDLPVLIFTCIYSGKME